MLLVSSFAPVQSWAGEVFEEERRLAERPPRDVVGEYEPAVRPDSHYPPSSGSLGPGSHGWSDEIVRPTVITTKFSKGDRFRPLIKEVEKKARTLMVTDQDFPEVPRSPVTRRPGMMPTTNPQLRRGRTQPGNPNASSSSMFRTGASDLSCSGSTVELGRGTTSAQLGSSGRTMASLRRTKSLLGYPRSQDAVLVPPRAVRSPCREAKQRQTGTVRTLVLDDAQFLPTFLPQRGPERTMTAS
mmetsp:Transcript_56357/g.119937  ORF Transcript_56357/g.119937 Transcript_56357/m.119937 type:complete len:242 (+) Transcript_56357:78-803(+)